MGRRFATVVCLAALIAGPALAHHNMAAIFDFSQRVTQTGVLKGLDWRNPHVQLFVDVAKEAGGTDTWSFEGPAPAFFRNRSLSRSDFEDSVGKTVTIEASRARDGSLSGLIRQVTLANDVVVSACPQNC